MDTGPGLYFHDTDVDSRRLREAFFSPVSSDPSKNFPKKNKKTLSFLIAIPIILTVILATYIGFSYDLVFLPKTPLPQKALQLLNKPDILSVSSIGHNPIKTTKSSLHIPIVRGEKTGLELNFKKPVNLNTHDIVLTVRNNSSAILMQIAAKDYFFYSNIKQPVRIVIDKTQNNSLFVIPLNLSENISSKVNSSTIQQIKFFFSPYDTSPEKTLISVNSYKKHMLIIKDILLVKKEGQ